MISSLLKLPFQIAYLKYKRLTAGIVAPRFINFITTFQCNSRCNMCGIWYKYISNPQELKNELSYEEIRDFLLRNRDFLRDLRHIGLTGGEPFLRKDIVEIVKSIREVLPHVETGIQTNGQMDIIKEEISQILEFYPKFSLAVSIDGTRETHDRVRGSKGSFDRAIDLIKYARSLGIPVTSGMTLTELNYREIKEVKKIADELGTEFSCFLPEEAEYFNNKNSNYCLDENMKKEISASLKELFSYHYYMDNLRLFMNDKRKNYPPCYSGYTSLVIDPYGNVKACILREDSFGNIREQSLREMLSSERACKIRKSLKNCSCWCQCEVSASAIVDPMDVFSWFLCSCCDKKGFIRDTKRKLSKLS